MSRSLPARRTLLIAVAAFLGPASSASATAVETSIIHTCAEDADSFPWILSDRPGLTISLLKMVEAKVGVQIKVERMPWKRCMQELKNGGVDAAFKISYSPARAMEFGVYPMLGDKVDARKRLLIDSYSLYRLKGASANWDGTKLTVDGPVGAQSGFSSVELLKSLGAAVDDGSRQPEVHLQKLLDDRVAAVALQTIEGDYQVAGNPAFTGRIEKVTPVLVEKPYFIVFSKQYYGANSKLAASIWEAIESVRESDRYRTLFKNFK